VDNLANIGAEDIRIFSARINVFKRRLVLLTVLPWMAAAISTLGFAVDENAISNCSVKPTIVSFTFATSSKFS